MSRDRNRLCVVMLHMIGLILAKDTAMGPINLSVFSSMAQPSEAKPGETA